MGDSVGRASQHDGSEYIVDEHRFLILMTVAAEAIPPTDQAVGVGNMREVVLMFRNRSAVNLSCIAYLLRHFETCYPCVFLNGTLTQ